MTHSNLCAVFANLGVHLGGGEGVPLFKQAVDACEGL